LHLLPLAGTYLPICLLAGCGTIGALRYVRTFLRYPWFLLACALFAYQVVSLFWAYSHRTGARALVYQMPFIFLPLAMAELTRAKPATAIRLMKIMLYCTVVQGMAVIVFRLIPQIKLIYINSFAANIFESANRLSNYSTADPSMNVLGNDKSAGLTTYPNPAAAWLGLSAMGAWYFAKYCKSSRLSLVAVINFIAVFFTGSKAGVITACGLFALMSSIELIQEMNRTRRLDVRYVIAACFTGALLLSAIPFADEIVERFFNDSSSTLSTRQQLWAFAQYEFHSHALLGMGFGGWEAMIPIFGRTPHMPPHNAFIILWAQSGILAVVLGLAFAVAFLAWAIRRMLLGSEAERLIAKGLFGGYLWVFIQAQGENFGIFGEDHIKPMLAITAGFLAGIQLLPKKPSSFDAQTALSTSGPVVKQVSIAEELPA